MHETLHEKAVRLFTPREIYSWRECLNLICPTQSSTAEHILCDMRTSGVLEQVEAGYRLNQ